MNSSDLDFNFHSEFQYIFVYNGRLKIFRKLLELLESQILLLQRDHFLLAILNKEQIYELSHIYFATHIRDFPIDSANDSCAHLINGEEVWL